MTVSTERRERRSARLERTAVKLTLCAPSRDALAQAMLTMQLRHAPDIVFATPRLGKYGAWVCEGTVFV